jgi:excisionase family DNA binding protein
VQQVNTTQDMPHDEIFTVNQAARAIGVAVSMLRRLIRDGSIWATSLENGGVGIRRSELQRFVEQYGRTPQMELADPKSIEDLLWTEPEPRQVQPRPKKTASAAAACSSHGSDRRCRCGVCTPCKDAARWERIFQEKFADPDYYTRRIPQQGSSLNGL